MRPRWTIVLPCWTIVLITGVAHAEPAKRASIEGRVTGPDGKPIEAATILLQSGCDVPRWPGSIATVEGPGVTKTDAHGRYRIAGIHPGRWFVAGIADGYAVGEYGEATEWRMRFPLDLAAGDHVEDVDLVLPWRWAVKGRCLDAQGVPMKGVSVFVSFELAASGRPVGHTGVATDATGCFDSGAVPVPIRNGSHGAVRTRLRARSNSYRFEDRELPPLQPGPGTTHDVGDWRALRPCSIHGVVERRDGEAVVSARVATGRGEGVPVARNGRFRLEGLAPGETFLRVLPGSFMPSTPGPRLDVAPGADVGPIRIVVEAPRTISGRVVDERGQAIEHAVVAAFPEGWGWMSEDECPRAWTDANGRFELAGVPPGRWTVSADHYSPNVEGRYPGSTARVDAGAGDVQLLLPRPWTLRYCVDAPPRAKAPRLAEHSVDGRLRRLAQSWDEGMAWISFRDPVPVEVQIIFGDRARWIGSVPAPPRGATIDLGKFVHPFAAPSRIVGTVVDPTGQPVRHPCVHAVHLATGVLVDDFEDALYGDVHGRFAIERLPAGAYALFAITPGRAHALLPRLEVAAGATTKARLECREPAPLELRVLTADGHPIEGARMEYRLGGFPYWFERDYRAFSPSSHGPDWTDPEGRLRRPLLPSGALELRVLADGYRTESRRVETGDSRSIVVRLQK